MAGEFQTHVDEMVREANLGEVRDQFNDLRRMDIKGKILGAVDGDGSLRKTIANNPFDINPAPPPVPSMTRCRLPKPPSPPSPNIHCLARRNPCPPRADRPPLHSSRYRRRSPPPEAAAPRLRAASHRRRRRNQGAVPLRLSPPPDRTPPSWPRQT